MDEKIKTLCNQVFEDIQSLRESGNYDVEKRPGVEIMALNAMCNAAKTILVRATSGSGKHYSTCLDEERE